MQAEEPLLPDLFDGDFPPLPESDEPPGSVGEWWTDTPPAGDR
jgi:hypothetical protein